MDDISQVLKPDTEQDDFEWAERSSFQQQQAVWKPRQPHQERKVRSPLVLGGHGVRLRIDRRSLFVQNGFTHYPQQREEWRFFPGHPDLPSRIVVVDADGSITFDVLAWLSTQGIPLVQVNWRGESMVVAGGGGYVADPKLATAQTAAQASKRRSMAISRWLVAEKIAASCVTLTQTMAASPARERALHELEASASEIKTRPPQTMDALRGIEGRVAQAYFAAWRSMPLRWEGLSRKPIPEEWHRIGPRVAPNGKGNWNATHPRQAGSLLQPPRQCGRLSYARIKLASLRQLAQRPKLLNQLQSSREPLPRMPQYDRDLPTSEKRREASFADR